VLRGPAARESSRFVAIDWMRGLVIVLMAIDHSSSQFNGGRVFTDSASIYTPHTPFSTAQFLSRWSSHLCAPTFVFLAGTALALSIHRRMQVGESAWSIDRHILLRSLVILACEPWFSLFFVGRHELLLQVLYAIGSSFLAMAALRRMPTWVLVALAGALLVLGEEVSLALGWRPPETTPLVAMLVLVPGRRGPLDFGYPALPWLAMMMLGWAFGRFLVGGPSARDVIRRLAIMGVGLLGLFVVVRGCNAYGNMGLLRDDSSLVQWLHVSKYPPSLSYAALELGLMALLLATFWASAPNIRYSKDGVLMVFGRTPMFFYLLPMPLLSITAHGLHLYRRLGLGGTYVFAGLAIVALYPLCRMYGQYKAAHPLGWSRYI
jgi:uncharacterized membrane protein